MTGRKTLTSLLILVLSGCSSVPVIGDLGASDPERLDDGPGPSVAVAPVSSDEASLIARAKSVDGMPDGNSASELRVHILNIGAGSCQIIECPESSDIIVADCGSMRPSDTDMLADDIVTYMDDLAFEENDFIVTLSHPHRDHINRIAALMEGRKTKSVWLGGDFDEYRGSAARYIEAAVAEGVPVLHGWPDDFSNNARPVKDLQCGAADTYVLTVNSGGDSKNGNSLMLMLEYGNFSMVFTGDAEGITERAAMRSYGDRIRNVTVLTSSHHGARTKGSNHQNWITTLDPQIVVYSSGETHGHPNRSVAERFRTSIDEGVAEHAFWTATSNSSPYQDEETTRGEYVTRKNGRILIKTDGEEFSIECSLEDDCF